jgi:outer membrane protein OmpA-like peptidoglycan-associated protein
MFSWAFLLTGFAVAQEAEEADFTCFNAQEIHFPVANNDFSGNKVLLNSREVNALYYLYQDKYSFWYKFIADKDVNIEFSVSATNENDRYHAVVFKYGKDDFCQKVINENLQPTSDLVRAPIFTEDDRLVYKNSINAQAGEVYYVSVLSLNRDDCGHFLYMESGGENLSINAIHKPCYNFTYLEIPDFTAARMPGDDPDLEIDFSEEDKKEGDYAAIKSIELQSKDENMVSVGDKLVLNKVYFYNNTFALKPGAEEELNQLVEFLKFNETVKIEIQGHAANDTEKIEPDPNFKGQGEEWNFKGSAFELSEKRAEEVKAYLEDKGIDKNRSSAKGYGDTQKRVENAKTFEEFEKNMRVEVLITEE